MSFLQSSSDLFFSPFTFLPPATMGIRRAEETWFCPFFALPFSFFSTDSRTAKRRVPGEVITVTVRGSFPRLLPMQPTHGTHAMAYTFNMDRLLHEGRGP